MLQKFLVSIIEMFLQLFQGARWWMIVGLHVGLCLLEKKDLWVAWIIEKGSIGMVDFRDTSEFE